METRRVSGIICALCPEEHGSDTITIQVSMGFYSRFKKWPEPG